MRFEDEFFSRADRYALGTETTSGRHYVSLPVSSGVVDYEEYYAITDEEHRAFTSDHAAAFAFAEECRRHEHDDRLLERPGSNRGTPT